ncbi:MAG: PPC domain-containing protein, partial [Cyanobacteria bacterium]|nr:PPC domain-containing protein [Cyanobacteriota bacterium]
MSKTTGFNYYTSIEIMTENWNVGANLGLNTGIDASIFGGLPNVFDTVQAKLQHSASNPDLFSQIFGDKANTAEIQSVRQQWSVGDFSQLPSVQILSAANANEALGAYVSSNRTVYLADVLFRANAAPSNSFLGAAGVLVEETFHWLDDLVGADTRGDEGELASNLIFGQSLSASELARIRSEDDTGFITINGQRTSAELNIDYAGNATTTGVVNIGGAISGTINFGGDTDWFRVNLVAGTTYEFRQNLTTLGDPFLTLFNSSSVAIASNDNSGGNRNSLITYTAGYTGTYYLGARASSTTDRGTYTVSAAAVDYAGNTLGATRNIGTLSGTQSFSDWVGTGDINDFYRFSVNAPSTFNLTLNGLSADANVELIQDLNNNGIVDAGEVLQL